MLFGCFSKKKKDEVSSPGFTPVETLPHQLGRSINVMQSSPLLFDSQTFPLDKSQVSQQSASKVTPKVEQSQIMSQIEVPPAPPSPQVTLPGKIKPKPGLKAFNEEELQVGKYLPLIRIHSSAEIENNYSRNMEDFEQTITMCAGRKSDSLHGAVSEDDLMIYVRDYYPSFREQMILREPPAEYRWMLWMVLAQQSDNITLHEYQFMTQIVDDNSDILIAADVDRTLPDYPFFAKKIGGRFIGRDKLTKLCKAVGVYFKHIGYTQGMSMILAEILMASGGEELESFRFYVHLMRARKLQLNGIIEDFFSMNHFLNYMFMEKLKKHLPEMADHVEDLNYPEHCWLTKWWISMFAGYLDDYLVLRILDLVLVTSIFSLVDVGLALVFMLQGKLLKADLGEFNQIISKIGKQPEIINHHPNKIIAVAIRYSSTPDEADHFMEQFGAHPEMSPDVKSRFRKHRENFKLYLRADTKDKNVEKLGHEDIAISVFSVRGKVDQFKPKDPRKVSVVEFRT